MASLTCPVCWRRVDVDDAGIVENHLDDAFHRCPLARRPAPPRMLREAHLEHTASDVLQLAADMHDDIEHVWATVDNASNQELREWLLIALAAINIDHKPSALFAWVHNLPAAVETVAA